MVLGAFILPCLPDPSSWVDDATITPHIYFNGKMTGNDTNIFYQSIKISTKKKLNFLKKSIHFNLRLTNVSVIVDY